MTASTPTTVTTTPTLKHQTPPPPVTYTIWWSNATFFVAVHILAALGAYYYPWYTVNRASLILCFLTWQAACFSITIGYHRLYSHKTFKAAFPVRVLLAALGASAFQGSIKWWALRHRLHHRFEDDPQHDPYCATEGMLWAHVGWIFYKRNYEKLEVIEKHDLESDIVVRTQHKYYLPFAILAGFVFPIVMGMLWDDPVGSFIWAGLVSKIMIWHCTFMVNSLAHWNGLQPYSDDTTSVSNLICAMLTCGEGNHNFHVRSCFKLNYSTFLSFELTPSA
ncbi:fatty acid desaturase type 1 family protein [Abortiporus biennis]